MGGPLVLIASEQVEKPVSAISNHWQISFARFISCPSLPPKFPSLVPLKRRSRGTWICSSSPTASMQLLRCQSSSDAILSIQFDSTILEEHYISKLRFTWPHVSCVSGYPARGSRAVFMSYKDSIGEIQKFAVQFSTNSEAETFINVLQDFLKGPTETERQNSPFRSEISSQSVLMSSSMPPPRCCMEELSTMSPVDTYSPEPPLSFEYEVDQVSCTKKTAMNHTYESVSAALPPSFTSLVTNCCSAVKQGAVRQSLPEELDLKSQIARYMEDSSFQDMLFKVEKVINEIGDGLLL